MLVSYEDRRVVGGSERARFFGRSSNSSLVAAFSMGAMVVETGIVVRCIMELGPAVAPFC